MLFKVDDSQVRQLFGGVKDDFNNQSQKINNIQNQVQAVDSAMDEFKYKMKTIQESFDKLSKKVTDVAKKGDLGKQKYEGLHKLMNSLFDDVMKVNEEVAVNRETLKRKQSIIQEKARGSKNK